MKKTNNKTASANQLINFYTSIKKSVPNNRFKKTGVNFEDMISFLIIMEKQTCFKK